MTNRVTIKLTANFERNLADIEQFLTEAEAPQAFDGLIDELLGTVLPNLERFPELGRPFFNRAVGSAEATNATAALKAKLADLVDTSLTSLREYVMSHYLVLYVSVTSPRRWSVMRPSRSMPSFLAGSKYLLHWEPTTPTGPCWWSAMVRRGCTLWWKRKAACSRTICLTWRAERSNAVRRTLRRWRWGKIQRSIASSRMWMGC